MEVVTPKQAVLQAVQLTGSDGNEKGTSANPVMGLVAGAPATTTTATISVNSASSAAIVLGGRVPSGIGVVAAPSSGYLRIDVCRDGNAAHYYPLKVDGSTVVLAAAANTDIGLGGYVGHLQGAYGIKFTNSGSDGTSANQATADATLAVGLA